MEFKIDMHTHPFSFDTGVDNVKEFILKARERGLDGVVATDHHNYYVSEPFEDYREFAMENGLYLYRGVEISTDMGHLLAYGIKHDRWNTWKKGGPYLDARKILRDLAGEGVFMAAAHPSLKRIRDIVDKEMDEIKYLHAFEAINARQDLSQNLYASSLCKKTGLKAIGGSDAHISNDVGLAYTVFERTIKDLDDLVFELKHGSYYPEMNLNVLTHK